MSSLYKTLCLLALALLSIPKVQAQGFPGEFQVAPRFSAGLVGVRDQIDLERGKYIGATTGAGLSFGYLAPFHVIAEIGAHHQEEKVLFEGEGDFFVNEFYAMAGFDIPLPSGWHISPKFGRVYWRLSPNDFDDDLQPRFSPIAKATGTADVYELSLRRYVDNQRAAFGVSFKDYKVADGHSSTASLDFVLRF